MKPGGHPLLLDSCLLPQFGPGLVHQILRLGLSLGRDVGRLILHGPGYLLRRVSSALRNMGGLLL
jgi:hypothetical protein